MTKPAAAAIIKRSSEAMPVLRSASIADRKVSRFSP